jgi:Xaa-Pro dipeptidase
MSRTLASTLVLLAVAVTGRLVGAQPAEAPDTARPAPATSAKARPKAAPRRPKGAPPPAPGSAGDAPVDPYGNPGDAVATVTVPAKLGITDIAAMQGLLAVQRLDGWLLQDREGQNPIALRLVAPVFRPQHAWFYLLPLRGEPVTVCHLADAAAFDNLAGKKITYQGYREQQKALRELLKGKKSLAMEVAPTPDSPDAAKAVDAGTREVLRGLKISVVSSDNLVQYTTAVWGEAGRTSHYVAVHHLVELRKDALQYLTRQLRAGVAVTELELAQRIARGMVMRGVVGPPPAVAAGVHTADPYYQPTAEKSAEIHQGDVVSIALALKVDGAAAAAGARDPGGTGGTEGIYAAQTWVAFAGAKVPERLSKLFDTVLLARDQAIALIADRYRKRRPLRGYEVDQVARGVLTKAGLGDRFLHRAGHSIDTSLDGAGADLDDYESKDTRSLVPGTGVTLGPGVYFAGELGVRSEVTLFLSPSGPEVTTPAQLEVEALLAP